MTLLAATERRPRRASHRTCATSGVLLRDGARLLAGMDEVGRGSLAGPVSVGVVVVDVDDAVRARRASRTPSCSPRRRAPRLLPALGRWGLARAVGHASAAEIDEVGIIAALRLAGTRALAAVAATVGPVDVVLLDGSHDWLSRPAQADLFTLDDDAGRRPHRACTCGSRPTGRAPPSRPRACWPSASGTR